MTDDELDRDDSRQRDSSLRSVHHSSNRSNNGEGNSLSPSLSLSVPDGERRTFRNTVCLTSKTR